jgi:hypothetical protein
VVIVVVEPAGVGGGAVGFGEVDAGVGPLLDQVRLNRSTLPLVWGRYGLVRLWTIGPSASAKTSDR